MDKRIIELEIKTAYQEDLLNTLNTIVSEQQLHILRLEKSIILLNERIQTLQNQNKTAKFEDEKPPHY